MAFPLFRFLVFAFALIDVILVFSLGPGLLAYLMTFFFSVSTHPVTDEDESVVGISVSAAREFAAFVPTFSP